MRTSVTIAGSVALLVIGYVVGASQVLSPTALFAQGDESKKSSRAKGDEPAGVQLSDETKTKIKAAADALKAAMESLQNDGQYESATKAVNAFAVLSGGGNSLKDLKDGPVVDPETYAALYSGLAIDAVVNDLGRDAEGRMTYKNRVIRMYPISTIRTRYAIRAGITGEELLPAATTEDASKLSKPKKKADEE